MEINDQCDYSSLCVSGNDALEFLQGQLTNDLARMRDGRVMRAAWCNPKGRVICLFHASKSDGGYRLALPTELASRVRDRMTMFRFRADVGLDVDDASAADLGASGSISAWRRANLRAGVPEIRIAQSEEFTPHMLNLDLLDAVSFDKGCYTGQEIVARTQYRGATRRRMFRFESAEPLGVAGPVTAGERKVGDVVNAIGTDLLAIVPVDSRDADLSVDGIALRRIALPYEAAQLPA